MTAFSDPGTDFSGSVPQVYEKYLVPLIFEPYARDMASRLAARPVSRILEIAAGTGVVTRRLAAALPDRVSIVSTDRSQAMVDVASAIGTSRPVEWRQADAMQLPFPEGEFDAVVIQFGVMFFPDKAKAHAEARRVLRPGGLLLFNVWDRLETNLFAALVHGAVAKVFPKDPPDFLPRLPYGYFDPARIRRDLAEGGFGLAPAIETAAHTSRADSARAPAVGFCQGSPLRDVIEARDRSRLGAATDAAEAAVAAECGGGEVTGGIQALVVAVEREAS